MPKIARYIILLLGVLLVAILLGVALLFSNLDSVVARGTERVLSHVLAVKVTVDSADVELRKGTIGLSGITIFNPPGYKTKHAMHFTEIFVEADVASLRTDQPHIRLIRIAAPEIIWERTATSSNLAELQANANRMAEEEPGAKGDPEGADMQMLIDRVEIQRPTVAMALPGSSQTVGLTTRDIVITDIGKDDERANPAEVMEQIIGAILLAAIDTVGDVREQVQEGAKKAIDAIDDKTEGARDAIRDAGREAGSRIDGLLGRRRTTESTDDSGTEATE